MPKFIDNSKQYLDQKDEAIERAFEIIGGLLERYAKQSCPVDTGLLRNSITYCLDGKHPHLSQYGAEGRQGFYDGEMPEEPEGNRAVYVGTNVEYAPYQEVGTSRITGKHFLQNSVQNHIGEYKNIMANELKKVGK